MLNKRLTFKAHIKLVYGKVLRMYVRLHSLLKSEQIDADTSFFKALIHIDMFLSSMAGCSLSTIF
jgi:hypothetical protein